MPIFMRLPNTESPLPEGECHYCAELFLATQTLFAELDTFTWDEFNWGHVDCGIMEGTNEIRSDLLNCMTMARKMNDGEIPGID